MPPRSSSSYASAICLISVASKKLFGGRLNSTSMTCSLADRIETSSLASTRAIRFIAWARRSSRRRSGSRGRQDPLHERARGTRFDRLAQVVAIAQERDARRDDEVGGIERVAAEHPARDPRVDAIEHRRQFAEKHVLAVGIRAERDARGEARVDDALALVVGEKRSEPAAAASVVQF